MLDITAVGPSVTVELLLDWTFESRSGGPVTLGGMPFRLVLLREPEHTRVLRLLPWSVADTGRIAGGSYRNRSLGVELGQPESASISRLVDGLTEMQVLVSDRSHPDAHVRISGHLADELESEDTIRMRLSSGDSELRPGSRLTAGDEAGHEPREHWVWRGSGGTWIREEWRHLTRGRRHFLIRLVAVGDDRGAAENAHADAADWFRGVIDSLRIR